MITVLDITLLNYASNRRKLINLKLGNLNNYMLYLHSLNLKMDSFRNKQNNYGSASNFSYYFRYRKTV